MNPSQDKPVSSPQVPVPTPVQSSSDRIADEHRNLRILIERLDETQELGALLNGLVELRTALVEHFANEEAEDGLRHVVGEEAPYRLGDVDVLFDEHREYLDDLDGLTTRAEEAIERREEIRRDLSGLFGKLHDHEARETDLLVDAAYVDLGRA